MNEQIRGYSPAEWFRAAELSLDESTASFRMRRTLAVTIFADFPRDRNRADFVPYLDGLVSEVRSILGEEGIEVVAEWGPHYGSYHFTLFGHTNVEEVGGSFRERIADIIHGIANLKETHPKTDAALTVVFFVGGTAVFFAGPGLVMAHAALEVPLHVFEAISLSYEAIEVPNAIRKLLKSRRPPPASA